MNNSIIKNKNIQFFDCLKISKTFLSAFVPKANFVKQDDLDKLNDFILTTKNLFVLSGAGLSTESGMTYMTFIFNIYQIHLSFIM
jgi:hypothetical protein